MLVNNVLYFCKGCGKTHPHKEQVEFCEDFHEKMKDAFDEWMAYLGIYKTREE